MKKYGLVSFCNLYMLPYANKYIEQITNKGYSCELVYWDRDIGISKDNYPNCKCIPYKYHIIGNNSAVKKLLGYIGATKFIINVIKKANYDGIIFLQSHAAVACYNVLIKMYKNKYIVDIRDYTLEKSRFYKKYEESIIENAFSTVISSPAYKEFLPPKEYIIAHNYNPFSANEMKKYYEKRKLRETNKIRISFVGSIRFIEMDKKLLNLFSNDYRFIISYYGRGSEVLKAYCEKMNIQNARFYGAFSPSDTIEFYSNTDLINNLYGNHTPFLDYALSNKLYHAALLHIPILVCPDTYMAEISTKYKIGYILDVDDKESPEKLVRWLCCLNHEEFSEGAGRLIDDVIKENIIYSEAINNFINS